MADTILLTGGTGFLGTELASRLSGNPEKKIYVLVRAADEQGAVHRLKGAWHHEAELYRLIGDRVFPVVGDFTRPGKANGGGNLTRSGEANGSGSFTRPAVNACGGRDFRGSTPAAEVEQTVQKSFCKRQDALGVLDAGAGDVRREKAVVRNIFRMQKTSGVF